MAAEDKRAETGDRSEEAGDGGPYEAARFVSDSVAELAQLSRHHGLDVLAHLLEMARMEADNVALQSLKIER